MGLGEACQRLVAWCGRAPVRAVLLAASLGTLVWFFFFVKIWVNGALTTARWSVEAWNPSGEQFHGWFILPISLYLVWYHRDRLEAAPKAGSNLGLVFVALGILFFVVGARTLQPRLALMALPALLFGATMFLWGWKVARIVLFPCAFLLFMIPVAALEQATFRLQFVITGAIGILTKLVGISVQAVGTTLTARDGSFNFEIAEGCSGIRSLAAMSMVTAIYVHLTQREVWKKIVIFGASLIFAIVGNVGRLFTIILVAKYINPKLAGGIYHDWSGLLLFFPIALGAMIGFSRLLNLDWERWKTVALKPDAPAPSAEPAESAGAAPVKSGEKKPASPISYDY